MKRIAAVGCCLAVLLSALALPACAKSGYTYTSYAFFGTYTEIKTYDGEGSREVADEITREFTRIDAQLSTRGNGFVKAFNDAAAGAVVPLDGDSYALMSRVMDYYIATEGRFNPALGHIIDLWGFSERFSDGNGEVPPQMKDTATGLPKKEYIDAFLTLSDFSEVRLCKHVDGGFEETYIDDGVKVSRETSDDIYGNEEGDWFIRKSGASVELDGTIYTAALDLGAVGKGYATDRAADILVSHGVTRGYVSVGKSSLRVLSNKDGGEFDIGIINPRPELYDASQLATVWAADSAISTSGDYQKYFEKDGVRYCHIIDGATGAPTRSTNVSLTIISHGGSAERNDAFSTALLTADADFIRRLAQEFELEVAAASVSGDGNIVRTNMAQEKVTGRLKNFDFSFVL